MAAAVKEKSARAVEIGERIALARKEADGMTQRELADLLGVTERSVAAYEAGDVIPYRFMRQLESLLNRPASWILYGEGNGIEDGELQRQLNVLTQKVDALTALFEAHLLPKTRTRK